MASFQYPDIPQIPDFADDQTYFYSSNQQYGQPHIHFYRDDSDSDDNANHNTSNMQPIQRYLHGMDPSPLSTGLLHANMCRIKTSQSQNTKQYERPWPTSELMTYSSRNASPDRTSTSSYAPQNELRSPHALHAIPYGSSGEFLQHTVTFSSPELMHNRAYPAELPLPGQDIINLRDLEIHHQEPEATVEDNGHVDANPEYDYEPEPTYTKMEVVTEQVSGDYKPYRDADMNNAMPVAEKVQPMAQGEESDSDYKPTSPKTNKRRRSTSSRTSGSGRHTQSRRSRKSSSASAQSSTNKITKKQPRGCTRTKSPINNNGDARPFPCPLTSYGCQSDFASKNEWKRHFSTQHLKLGFWRCDLCPTTSDPNDSRIAYHNDFNRKDLFTQHLRRMHFARPNCSILDKKKDGTVTEDILLEAQTRCYMKLRGTPEQSGCLFCEKRFEGEGSWEERMEHVGRHLEKDRKIIEMDVAEWNRDEVLEQWLVTEGLITRERDGTWRIGTGKPRRESTLGSADESDED